MRAIAPAARRAAFAVLVVAPFFAAACETPVIQGQAGPPKQRAPLASASAPTAKPIEYTENDFVENDTNRDPFRSFLTPTQQGPRPAPNQRKVELAQYGIDDLKLVAIVLGDEPRAMLVDPHGLGTVVYKNTYICRPDQVHLGGANGADYEINWRIERIRDGEVDLIRVDPSQPAVQPARRVLLLHPEADQQQDHGRIRG